MNKNLNVLNTSVDLNAGISSKIAKY